MPKKNIKAYFEVKNNDFFYYPPREPTDKFSHSLKLEGKWLLSGGNLIFIADESYNTVFGQSISFSTKLEKASKNYIRFSALKRTTPKLHCRTLLQFDGHWKADSRNNLIFAIKRGSTFDELSFGNNWQVTKENNILLLYKRRFLKKEIISSLVLDGSWGLGKNALEFAIEGSGKDKIKFDLALAANTVIIKKEKIALTIGLRKDSAKSIALYGRCKYSKDRFEFTVRPGKETLTWIFKLNKHLSSDKELIFELINEKNKPLGAQITFSKRLASGGNLFIRAKAGQDKRIEAGLYLPF
ncbi:MAG: hypothetical protein PHT53_01775 [Candidatus Omnitrophica bacterium]|nr:hypothetical protein [Candidatus Omnitrophota bacterium]